ncbi:hypothetical protein FCULG_00006297 [Fusarium culmorum]|uniref:Uncharacterized protein n=1 Tax=Fusarium culmorum TaxID=5516 RepID=A0A2T4GTK9_FUSCU|nr:hypothetical protein FCULG_00006297 [Fusarium culmorum]
MPWFTDDVRVVDGVGRKKRSKNLPKDSRTYMSLISIFSIDANYVTEKAKHKVKKPACPQKGSQGRSLPLQNLQLQNLQAVHQPVQAGAFLHQDIFGALPQANNVHPQPVVNNMHAHPQACNVCSSLGMDNRVAQPPASLSRPSPVVDDGHAAFQSVVNYQVAPEFKAILNDWSLRELSLVNSVNIPQHWGQISAAHGSCLNAGGTYFPGLYSN